MQIKKVHSPLCCYCGTFWHDNMYCLFCVCKHVGVFYVYMAVEARVQTQVFFRSDPPYFLRQELLWPGAQLFVEAGRSVTPESASITLELQIYAITLRLLMWDLRINL